MHWFSEGLSTGKVSSCSTLRISVAGMETALEKDTQVLEYERPF